MTNHLNKIIALKNKKPLYSNHLNTILALKSISGGSPSVPVPYQLIENGDFASTDKWSGSSCGIVASNNTGVATVTTASTTVRIAHEEFEITKDHKYYYQIMVYAPKQIKFKISRSSTTITTQEISTINEWVTVKGIYTHTATAVTIALRYYFDLDKVLTALQKVYFRWAEFIDLTATFGVGNEPTSVEEVNRLYPNSYYEYKPIE